jgi:hypothetical protein
MLNKVIASFFAAFLLTLSGASSVYAEDVPVLTWEKGKEHNVILGGDGKAAGWQVNLVSTSAPTLTFRQSKVNEKGFAVFSVDIPNDYPEGVYTIETIGQNAPKKVVAGIKLVALNKFNLIQIPMKLFIILLTLILLVTTMSIMRMSKYERIEYLRENPKKKISAWVKPFYKLRVSAIEEIKRSIFKFQIIREGELLHKLSPTAWSVVPLVSVLIGAYVGVSGNLVEGVKMIPVILFFAVAMLGVIDPFSGFTATLGFAFIQTLIGNITSVRSFMSILAVGIGWVAPGILSSLYQGILRKDRYFGFLRRLIPDFVAASVGGLVFLVSQLLTNSFTDHVGPIAMSSINLPVLLGVFILARMNLERFLSKDLHQTGENYQIRVLVLPRVIAPRTIVLAALYFAGTTYVWTESWKFAGMTAFLLSFPLSLLMVRFESPSISILNKFNRNIVLESIVMLTIAFGIFYYVQTLPLEVMQKGKMFILYAAVLLFVHGFYSSIYDTTTRKVELVE